MPRNFGILRLCLPISSLMPLFHTCVGYTYATEHITVLLLVGLEQASVWGPNRPFELRVVLDLLSAEQCSQGAVSYLGTLGSIRRTKFAVAIDFVEDISARMSITLNSVAAFKV